MEALQGIMDELLTLKAADVDLFSSRFSSDGPVGRRYDFGTNAKACYAFDSMAYLLKEDWSRTRKPAVMNRSRQGIRSAIKDNVLVDRPIWSAALRQAPT